MGGGLLHKYDSSWCCVIRGTVLIKVLAKWLTNTI